MTQLCKRMLFSGLGAGLATAAAVLGTKQLAKKLQPQAPDFAQDDLVLYQFEYSPYCVKVRYCLQYKGLAYQTVDLAPVIHQGFSRQHSGQVKVPYLKAGKQIITDSSQIALYLEERQPAPSLIPANPEQREAVLLLEDWLDEAFQPAMARRVYLELAMHPERLIQDPNLKTGVALLDPLKPIIVPLLLKRSLKRQRISPVDLETLEQRLQSVLQQVLRYLGDQPYLIGDQITLADLTLAAHLRSADRLPHLKEQADLQSLFAWRDVILESLPAAK